jgi:nitrite reductase/ring-hydroxylating ferredoxin subunit
MAETAVETRTEADHLVPAGDLDELTRKGAKIVKAGKKQIVVFKTETGLYACNNRCPHEGYPLIEGTLAEGCVLTCNWHNWKFDLESGATLIGGDKLRRYPVTVRDGQVWIDVSDPPAEEVIARALENLHDCFRREETVRMARELARLQRAGGDPLDAVRAAFDWTHEHLEFGALHSQGAAADWLALRETQAEDEAERLVPLVEIIGHLCHDSLREHHYPFAKGRAAFDPEALAAAIEAEEEDAAVAQVRGALAEGRGFSDLRRPLSVAALAHYNDFGHSLIYVNKTGELIGRLGGGVAEPALLALVRALVKAFREDLIPEFRTYAGVLSAWDGTGAKRPSAADFAGLDAKRAMALAVQASGDPARLYGVLLEAGAWGMLHFDLGYQARTDGQVSQNVGWLDYTHHITFANAVRTACEAYPELWPQGLLQMACFVGRNARYVDGGQDTTDWAVDDPQAFLDRSLRSLFDHGQPEFIVSAHLIKILAAVRAEVEAAPGAAFAPVLLAATNRFLNAPLKRRHTLRAANQALDFVEIED